MQQYVTRVRLSLSLSLVSSRGRVSRMGCERRRVQLSFYICERKRTGMADTLDTTRVPNTTLCLCRVLVNVPLLLLFLWSLVVG